MGRFYVRSFWKGLCWESLHCLIHRARGFLSLGPAFPKYLSHRGILVLGAKCRSIGWCLCSSRPVCSAQPCHTRGLQLRQAAPAPRSRPLAASAVMLLFQEGFSLFSLWLKYPKQCLWEHGAWDGHEFLLECKRPVYFSGYVPSMAKDVMAAVGAEQRCTKLSGVGDDSDVFKATRRSQGLCCLRNLSC